MYLITGTIYLLPYIMLISEMYLLLAVNCIKCVSLKFIESKFVLNHSLIRSKSMLISFRESVGFEYETNILLSSSADKIFKDLLFIILGRSLRQRRNNEGPRVDSCRTQRFISSQCYISFWTCDVLGTRTQQFWCTGSMLIVCVFMYVIAFVCVLVSSLGTIFNGSRSWVCSVLLLLLCS